MRRGVQVPVELLQPWMVGLPEKPQFFDYPLLFGNAHPVELEVGFGKGLFLINAALARPGTNFLGLEIDRKCQLFTANKLARRQIGNVRLVCANARDFLPQFIAPDSLQAVHVYFPDPWWKNRHRKRRLFTGEFAAECQRILIPGSLLHLATDVEEYFKVMTKVMGLRPGMALLPPPGENPPENDLDYLTNFERKYRQQGRAIYRSRYQKV